MMFCFSFFNSDSCSRMMTTTRSSSSIASWSASVSSPEALKSLRKSQKVLSVLLSGGVKSRKRVWNSSKIITKILLKRLNKIQRASRLNVNTVTAYGLVWSSNLHVFRCCRQLKLLTIMITLNQFLFIVQTQAQPHFKQIWVMLSFTQKWLCIHPAPAITKNLMSVLPHLAPSWILS